MVSQAVQLLACCLVELPPRPRTALGCPLALIAALMLNGVFIGLERIPVAQKGPEVEKVYEVLRHLQYLPSTRRSNFKEMGMSDDLAEATAKYVDRYTRKQKLFRELLNEQAS